MKAKQINFKRMLLFLVEGATDKISLENILKKNIRDKKVCFKIVNGDVTSEADTTTLNVESKIAAFVKDFLARNRAFKRTDIIEIVHLTDLDGVYLKDKRVAYDKDAELTYGEKIIVTNKSYAIIERNKRKSEILTHLSGLTEIGGVGYSIYYFSTNLEHVFYDDSNCTDDKKENKAYDFAKGFAGCEDEFLNFLQTEDIVPNMPYKESWEHVRHGINSLKRLTNIDLLLKKYSK
ncbi:MAG: hypothetical protein LBT20_03100 [Clostridiales bacterium]|jgi:hypothetical protein|nr:hypothetical protein [Clostridiales bacterium]